ncbi:hypothetical protein CYMTET_30555 [Cymbomonas tetramitiformis]|uniref:BTB domain-containing protein n=1 Tax=Cymbomonas tetramitiformis TaxID=36881 RepID=A0AAE0FIU3_9CHLO|nr:hypothetical protein CYMTET_30555 [Cymbomonas tetramitiformis]
MLYTWPTLSRDGTESDSESQRVRIEDVSPEAFNCILQYVYGNEPSITLENLTEVLYAAEKYALDGLKECVLDYVNNNITHDGSAELLTSAAEEGLNSVIEVCAQLVQAASVKEVFLTDEGMIVEKLKGKTMSDIEAECHEEQRRQSSLEEVDDALRHKFRTSSTLWGYQNCLRAINSGRATLVVLTHDVPNVKKKELEYAAMLMKVGVHQYPGSTERLNIVCRPNSTENEEGFLVFTTSDEKEGVAQRGRGVVLLYGNLRGQKAVITDVSPDGFSVRIIGLMQYEDSSGSGELRTVSLEEKCSNLLFTRYWHDVDSAPESEVIQRLHDDDPLCWLFTELGKFHENAISQAHRKRRRCSSPSWRHHTQTTHTLMQVS